jgi:hypothetical protein
VKTRRPKGCLGLILRLFRITITEVATDAVELGPVAATYPDDSI